MIKRYFKQKLDGSPKLYQVLASTYRLLPHKWPLVYRKYKKEKVRKECFRTFENGEKVLTTCFGGINVKFEAISPKNYWHLTIGSQHEDDFAEDLFNKYVSEGMVVLDVGGHTGMYTVPFAISVGNTGKVYVVEPEEKGFRAIQRNIELNELNNVILLKMAVSDKKGVVDFYIRPDKDTHSIFEKTRSPSPLGIQDTIQIETSTIDDMVEEEIIQQPDFVKIDTEGAELKILDGMKESAKHIKHILVEIHAPALELEGIANPNKEVEQKLQLLGFNDNCYLDEIHILASKA